LLYTAIDVFNYLKESVYTIYHQTPQLFPKMLEQWLLWLASSKWVPAIVTTGKL